MVWMGKVLSLRRLKFIVLFVKYGTGKMTTVAVIGAGISGLSAAYYLSKASHLKVISASIFCFEMLNVDTLSESEVDMCSN